ncbi:MAG: ABC transporter permease [Lachnospiraceae bacterium]|nr:ABC transporter permease [Lachnospiraceae bacterium]
MMFLENLRLAFSSLMANKMRAILTMLGIIIGISAVIAIITVGNSLSASVTDSMSSLGANNVNIYLDYKEVEDEVTEEGYIFKPDDPTKARITEEDLISKDMIKELCATYPDEIYAVALERQVGTGEVTVGKETAKVNMIGANVGDFVQITLK